MEMHTTTGTTGLPRAAVVAIERDHAILENDWARAAVLSDELADMWEPTSRNAADGYRHSAAIYRERAATA